MTYFPSYEGIISMSQLQLSKWDLFEPYMEFIHRLMNYPAGPTQEEKERASTITQQSTRAAISVTPCSPHSQT